MSFFSSFDELASHCKVLLLLCVTIGCAMAGPEARAQAARVDYESSQKPEAARKAAEWRLAFRPNSMVMRQTVMQLRKLSGVSQHVATEVDAILTSSASARGGDERRALAKATMLLLGRAWSPQQETLAALSIKASTVWQEGRGQIQIGAEYPVPAINVHYHIDLYQSEATSSATPRKGKLVRKLAEGELPGNLPQSVKVDLSSLADGAYLLQGEFQIGAESGTPAVEEIFLIHDLSSRYVVLKRELADIHGHQDAKATAEYPYYLAEALRAGTRQVISYDFPRAMARSAQIADDLRAGRDPVWRATGLQNRAYKLAGTDALVPYQLYVPVHWSSRHGWPLVVALHGANLDETNMLGRANGEMQKLAEQYGFIVVAPLGYRLNSMYGSERGLDGEVPSNQTPNETRSRQLSEDDVFQVMHLIEKEYGVDPARRYLTGNSMGGAGTWWIGGHRPDLWAAIAPAAYGGVLPGDVPGLSRVPIVAVVGDHDEIGMLARVRASVAVLKAGGVNPEFLEVVGGTHKSAFDVAMPAIFKFFSEHTK